jgi:DNA invertase Pin-like site-specific DNA recombinase
MQAGVHAARTRGRTDGPPKSPLNEEKKLRVARQMYENKTMPVGNILKGIGIPRSTFYKYVRKYADKPK